MNPGAEMLMEKHYGPLYVVRVRYGQALDRRQAWIYNLTFVLPFTDGRVSVQCQVCAFDKD